MTRALLVLVLCTPAFADDDPAVTLAYISGSLRNTTAVFSARYTMKVHGETFTMGLTSLPMPVRGAVTAIVVHAPDGDHALGLLPAAKARKQFEDETTEDSARGWALLAERRFDSLELSVAAPRSATLTIDVTVEMPTCFFRDTRFAEIPLAWKSALSPNLVTRRRACDRSPDSEAGHFVAFPTTEANPERIGTNAARVDLGDAHLAELEVVAATKLGEIPDDLATVILVDGSRSMSAEQYEAQRAFVKAYARAAGTTQLQVIAYARTARALLPAWTPGRIAKIDRALATLAPRNGSNIDVGFIEAARWLAQTSGTKRIVLLTDEQLSRRLNRELDDLAKKLAPDALVHVVGIDAVGALRRDRGMIGNTLAESTGGIAMRAGVPDDNNPLDVTELLRPMRIERFEITAPGWRRSSSVTTSCRDELVEGTSCRWLGEGDVVAGPLAASGYIWGKKWSRVVTPNPERAAELARSLLADGLLDDRVVERARRIARAANEGWSFYGEWGGRGAYHRGSIGLHGFSTRGGRMGFHSAPSVMFGRSLGGKLPDFDLAPQLVQVIGLCNLVDVEAEIEVETTLSEIVEVRVLAPPSVSRCVEDAVWDTAISVPAPLRRTNTRVVLPARQ
jgi:hypothetical protein